MSSFTSYVFDNVTFEDVASWGGLNRIPAGLFDGARFRTDLFVIPSQIGSIDSSTAFASATFGQTNDVFVSYGVTNIGNVTFYGSRFERISVPSTDVSFGNVVFGYLPDIGKPRSIYFRGKYPKSIADTGNFYDGSVNLTTYIRPEHVGSWETGTGLSNISANDKNWLGFPIRVADWDWDEMSNFYDWWFTDAYPSSSFPANPLAIMNADGWAFTVSISGNSLTLLDCVAYPASGAPLDFSGTIEGGGKIVSFGSGMMPRKEHTRPVHSESHPAEHGHEHRLRCLYCLWQRRLLHRWRSRHSGLRDDCRHRCLRRHTLHR
jgi:hypothetical protein